MASDSAEGALSGAASGATTGMAAGPWGALVGAAVGAIGGFMHGRALHKQQRQINKQRAASAAKMRALATPEHLGEVMNRLQPLMRNVVESGLGPQFRDEVNRSLASHGLTGTGAGESIRELGTAAPGIFATQAAAEGAKGVVGNELNAEASASGLEPVAETANPLLDALLSGTRGYLSGGGTFGRAKQTPAPAPAAGAQAGQKDPYSLYGDRAANTGD